MSKHGRLYLHEVVVKWGIGIMRIVATCDTCGAAVQIGANGLPVDDAGCNGNRGCQVEGPAHVVPITVFEPGDGGARASQHGGHADTVKPLLNGSRI